MLQNLSILILKTYHTPMSVIFFQIIVTFCKEKYYEMLSNLQVFHPVP
jgi:hypothetical protein